MKLPKTRYIDIPKLHETYADSIGHMTFDSHVLRLELCVTRMDDPKPPAMPTGRQYPACRLVIPIEGAVDLFNRLQQLISVLQTQGAVKQNPPDTIN